MDGFQSIGGRGVRWGAPLQEPLVTLATVTKVSVAFTPGQSLKGPSRGSPAQLELGVASAATADVPPSTGTCSEGPMLSGMLND